MLNFIIKLYTEMFHIRCFVGISSKLSILNTHIRWFWLISCSFAEFINWFITKTVTTTYCHCCALLPNLYWSKIDFVVFFLNLCFKTSCWTWRISAWKTLRSLMYKHKYDIHTYYVWLLLSWDIFLILEHCIWLQLFLTGMNK